MTPHCLLMTLVGLLFLTCMPADPIKVPVQPRTKEKKYFDDTDTTSFGQGDSFRDYRLLDWDRVYDKRGQRAKRFGLESNDDFESHAFNGALNIAGMQDWSKSLLRKRLFGGGQSKDFGQGQNWHNLKFQNWSMKKKREGLGNYNKQGFGESENALHYPKMQDWNQYQNKRIFGDAQSTSDLELGDEFGKQKFQDWSSVVGKRYGWVKRKN